MKNSQNSLVVKSFTWNKDSNELFDYESSVVNKDSINVLNSGYLTRQKDDVKFVENLYHSNTMMKTLLHLEYSNTQFYANQKFEGQNNLEKVWLSLRYLKSKNKGNGYFVNQGDILKLGRIKFKVRDIKLEKKTHLEYSSTRKDNIVESNVDLNKFYKNESTKEIITNSKRVCRICYCNDKEVDSPLLNPCNCLGGVKYIHFSCLQQWLKSRCIIRSSSNGACVTYTIKQMECELCKVILPDFVKYHGKVYEIWNFIQPEFKNYICLESLISDKNTDKQLHMISFDKKNLIKIGRSHEADLRINDISVSRFHANLVKTTDLVQFEDCNSKFGTLVLLQNTKVPIRIENHLPLQIGRSVVLLIMKESWKLFGCFSCGGDSPRREVDYSSINKGYIDIDKVLSVKIQIDNDLLDEDNSITIVKASNTIIEGQDLLENISQNNILTSNYEREEEIRNSESSIVNGKENGIFKGTIKKNSINYMNKSKEKEADRKETNLNVNPNEIINNLNSQVYNITNKKGDENIHTKYDNENGIYNTSAILNIKHNRKLVQPSILKQTSLSPVKINLNIFKKYEEDVLTEANQYKNSESQTNRKKSMNDVNTIELNNNDSREENKNIFRSIQSKKNYFDQNKLIPSELSSVKESNRVILFQPK